MSGPRLTAPAAKLARSISTSASTSVPQSGTLITSSKYAAPLSRKYADLLEERNIDSDPQHPRHMYTRSSNRPHPPPQRIRLMQTFSSSSARPAQSDKSTIDFATLPSYDSLRGARDIDPVAQVRMPLLPDNYLHSHAPEEAVAPLPEPVISVIASHPENVIPAALTEVEGMGVDGVELSFAHEGPAAAEEGQGMLRDIWRGLVDDVFGSEKGKTAV